MRGIQARSTHSEWQQTGCKVLGGFMRKQVSTLISFALAVSGFLAGNALAQGTPLAIELLPLGKDIGIASGQTVTPAYEGWYESEDGTIAVSFGFYNRNTEEVVDIPIGPANRILGLTEGDANQGQPTRFVPGRHWGVFTVNLPAGSNDLPIWHLENQGKTFHIPANLSADYVIDAIAGDANGNFPPELRFQENGPVGRGPGGIILGPLQATVGEPVAIDIWAGDDGKVSGLAGMFMGRQGFAPPVIVTWFEHQGPGSVEFSEPQTRVPGTGGQASTEASFSDAGEYLLRVRVTDAAGPAMAGHSQCCWTNSFVKVNVSH